MRRTMIMAAALAASASMAALSGPASAQSVEFYVGPGYDSYGYTPYGRSYYYGAPAYGYSTYRRGGYYARPEHFRYGSERWWRQMDRTGRGGHQE